jgi:hypothetical protein
MRRDARIEHAKKTTNPSRSAPVFARKRARARVLGRRRADNRSDTQSRSRAERRARVAGETASRLKVFR